jgi:protein TonB
MAAAGQLLLTPRLRPRTGPALRPAPLPVTATVLSVICHGALAAGVILAAQVWSTPPTKTYVVNLVPAVAGVGSPQARPTAALPPRAEEPPPRVTRRDPSELPVRETPRTPEPPPPAPELPTRAPALPEMPARASTPTLPDRALPRPSAAPRPGDKELPAVASTPKPAPPAPAPPSTAATGRPEPPPPAPLGRASGSAQGVGALTLDVTDFPFAWYLAAVQRKITERWDGRALPGRQPVLVFEIARDGQVARVLVKDSSGNSAYDRAATRAIAEAAPFPRLPDEWPRPSLVIQMGFNFAPDRG